MTVFIPAPAYDWSVDHFPGVVPPQITRRAYGRGSQVEIEPSDAFCAELAARIARKEVPPLHRTAVRRALEVLSAALNPSTPEAV